MALLKADEPVIILADPEPDPTPLGLTVESLLRTGHAAFIAAVPPESRVMATIRAGGLECHGIAPAAHPLLALHDALRLVPPGRLFAFVATGYYLTQSLLTAFADAKPRHFGLAAPAKRHGYMDSYHTRLLLGQGGEAVRHEVAAWLRDSASVSDATAKLYGSRYDAGFTRQAAKSHEGGGTIIARCPERWWRGPDGIDSTMREAYVPGWLVTELAEAWQMRVQETTA